MPAPAHAVVPPKGVIENKRTLRKQASIEKTSVYTRKKTDNKCSESTTNAMDHACTHGN
jgi:hypothetical protein